MQASIAPMGAIGSFWSRAELLNAGSLRPILGLQVSSVRCQPFINLLAQTSFRMGCRTINGERGSQNSLFSEDSLSRSEILLMCALFVGGSPGPLQTP